MRGRGRVGGAGLVVALVLAGCGGGDDEPDTPAATVQEGEAAAAPERSSTTPTAGRPTTTAAPLTPEQEVEQAYLRSWDVYARAMRTLDATQLPKAFAGEALALRRDDIARLRVDGTPARIEVEHNIESIQMGTDRATVIDRHLNHSVTLNAAGEPLEADPNSQEYWSVELQDMEGTWRVVFITDLQ